MAEDRHFWNWQLSAKNFLKNRPKIGRYRPKNGRYRPKTGRCTKAAQEGENDLKKGTTIIPTTGVVKKPSCVTKVGT